VSVHPYLHNSYNTPAILYLENKVHILSQEGMIQDKDDNQCSNGNIMIDNATSTLPLIQEKKNFKYLALSNETEEKHTIIIIKIKSLRKSAKFFF